MKPTTQRFQGGVVLVLFVAGVSACGGGGGRAASPPSPEAAGLPQGHPVVEASSLDAVAETAAETAAPTAGIVQETLAGGGYTYARVQVGEEEIWVAGPETPLEVGTEIGIAGAMPMGNFSSPSLERTFENLYFVGGFQTSGPPPGAVTGEALEVLVGGGYTYVRATVGEEEFWLAGPQMEIFQGDTVSWKDGMEMGEFTSSSLGRTFENIVFVSRFWVTRD